MKKGVTLFQSIDSLIQSCTELDCHTASQKADVLLKLLQLVRGPIRPNLDYISEISLVTVSTLYF